MAAACAGCRTEAGRREPGRPPTEQETRFVKLNARLRAAEPEMRQQAAVALLTMDYDGAVDAVLEAMMSDPDPAVRISMIRAAAFCSDARCFAAILGALEDPDPAVPAAAATAVARFTEAAQLDAVEALVRRPATSAEQRELLFRALGEAIAVRAVPVLIAGLDDPNQAPRDAAWESLKRISGRQLPAEVPVWNEWWSANAHLTREDVLEDRLRTVSHELAGLRRRVESSEDQQAELVALLSEANGHTPERLVQALGSRHEAVRVCAAVSLAALAPGRLNGFAIDAESHAIILRALQDDSETVRWSVLQLVVGMDGPRRDDLVAAALDDESPRVLRTAVEAVREGASPEAVRRIEDLLRDSPREDVREAAAAALGKLGDEGSVEALMAALSDVAENVRWFAVEGLGKLGASQAVPQIAEMLGTDESRIVRAIAASTLGDLGQPAAIPALRSALDDANERVRENAVGALQALATSSCERMVLIAGVLEQHDLLSESREVLLRLVDAYADDAAAASMVFAAYESLADIARRQDDMPAAARAYSRLIGLAPGNMVYREGLVACRLRASEHERLVAEIIEWLGDEDAGRKAAVLAVALDAAEALIAAGGNEEARKVLDAAAGAAGAEVDEGIAARIVELRTQAG
jgi:HEAT repeat protein